MSALLSVRETAAALNLSERRVRKLCLDGRLGTKVGRDYAITVEELRAFKRKPRPVGKPRRENLEP